MFVLESCVSEHFLEFILETNDWCLKDLDSRNVSFVFIKIHTQYYSKNPSYLTNLFEDD